MDFWPSSLSCTGFIAGITRVCACLHHQLNTGVRHPSETREHVLCTTHRGPPALAYGNLWAVAGANVRARYACFWGHDLWWEIISSFFDKLGATKDETRAFASSLISRSRVCENKPSKRMLPWLDFNVDTSRFKGPLKFHFCCPLSLSKS